MDDDLHVRLCEAASRGDWKSAEKIEKTHKGVLSEVIRKDRKETALHIATKFNHTAFVEKLIEKITEKDLEATNIYGNTALSMAATLGAVDIANSMLQKNKDLVLIRGSENATPILVAARYKQNHMVSYLLKHMDLSIQSMATSEQMELLLSAIATDHYDIALLILNGNKSLALERDAHDDTPLHIMARKSNTIGSKNNLTKWQSSINSCLKHIYKKEIMQTQAHQTVELMWSVVLDKIEADKSLNIILHPSSMLHDAASIGNVEFEVEDVVECVMKRKEEKPRQLFTEEHKELAKEGEKWVKSAANSCMLLAPLIITVALSAAFTLPGGNNENTGSPMFLYHKLFTVFTISDATALISSSVAFLWFSSISMSRRSETDFLYRLPLKLVLGLGLLFLSFLGMVLAFDISFFLHYGKDSSWVPMLIAGMSTLPIYWFCALHGKLWADCLAALHACGVSYLRQIRLEKELIIVVNK
ncbi:Ankyrin repeat-containing protein, partial [Cucurbita argyrosperma subsp. sororia]